MAIVLSVILFGIAAFWMYRFSQKSLDARKQLICFYGAEIVCLWLSMCFFVHAFSKERVMQATYDHIIYVSALFLFPFLHLVFLCAMKGKTLMRTTIMKHTLPHIVIALLTLAIYFAIEQGLRIPDSVSRVLIIVFKGLLFCSVMVYSSLFVFRYAFYRRLVKRIFSDATQTDYPIVSRIGGIAMAEGIVMYMMLCRGFLNLEGDWLALLILCGTSLAVVALLGWHISLLRGTSVPSLVQWSDIHLSDEGLQAAEYRLHMIDSVKAAEDATVNIAHTLERWLTDASKPYLRQGLTISDVANATCISPKLLSAYLNRTLQMNFNQWINQYRLKEVKLRLLSSDLSLDEIAYECGFGDRSVLSRVFKTSEGISPSEFRNQAISNNNVE